MKIREGFAEEEVGSRTQTQGTDKKGSKRKTDLSKDLNFVLLFYAYPFLCHAHTTHSAIC